MEVCGSHTKAIYEYGLKQLLPPTIKLISGPGCPICVTLPNFIDQAIQLALNPHILLATFGDLMKVPGSQYRLQDAKRLGANIVMVYSPLDVIKLANQFKDKQIVFVALGFETTAPIVGLLLQKLEEHQIQNVKILNGLKQMPNAIQDILLDKCCEVDAFLCPGHVATVIGTKPFENLALTYQKPMVISGFELDDLLRSLYTIINCQNSQPEWFSNQYPRFVRPQGNLKAQQILEHFFHSCKSTWRGLGTIENTGFKLKEDYQKYDASYQFNLEEIPIIEPIHCQCANILKGKQSPTECPLFKTVCKPDTPIGPCMVSDEGACANAYYYEGGSSS